MTNVLTFFTPLVCINSRVLGYRHCPRARPSLVNCYGLLTLMRIESQDWRQYIRSVLGNWSTSLTSTSTYGRKLPDAGQSSEGDHAEE